MSGYFDEIIACLKKTAADMYECGWRAKDVETLVREYVLDSLEMHVICGFLTQFEMQAG